MNNRAGSSLPWGDIQKIIVLRALYLGDMLCAIPALRALKRAAPRASVTLVGLPWAREFCLRFRRYVDQFIEFPGFPGLPEQPLDAHAIVGFLAHVQRDRFDLAIQLHGSGAHVNEALALFGARRMAGYYRPGEYCPDADTFLEYPDEIPEIARHLQLVKTLGATSVDARLEFEVDAQDERRLAGVFPLFAAGAPYICLHPGAKLASRRWPVERFAAVGDALGASGYHLVLTGSAGEAELVAALSAELSTPHANLCGLTNLGMLAALVRGADLLVTNDTGVSHIAAAVRTPSVVIVLGSDAARWAPLDRRLHRVVAASVECRPCEHAECPIGFPCALDLHPATVLQEARDLLHRFRRRRRTGATGPEATVCVA
jgi:ADP-heptose:LPS heptosyltransferase